MKNKYIYIYKQRGNMDEKRKKSTLVFNLYFTTSKLLSYIVIITSSILGYLLSSVEVVAIGLIVGAALSGVKNITESLVKLKSGILAKTSDSQDLDNTENKQELTEKEKEIL